MATEYKRRNFSKPFRRSVISTLPEIDDALPRDMPRSFKEDNLKQYLEQADLWLNHLSMKPVGYTFESIPILIPTQWEADRSKRISRASQSSTTSTSSSISAQFFERLPREIHHCILNQLKHLHGEPSHICPGCWQRDLYSLSLVSRGWSRVAREQLYRDLWLPATKPSNSITGKLRSNRPLELLRRTIEHSPGLALMVKAIEVPRKMQWELCQKDHSSPAAFDTAAIIRACPNLEGYGKFHVAYEACCSFNRLLQGPILQALASRPRFKEHLWTLKHGRGSSARANEQDGLEMTTRFLSYHDKWRNLETLVLLGHSSDSSLSSGTIYQLIQKLPALKHLHLAGLSPKVCHDGTLQALPSLQSLRLEGLSAVTDQGLEHLFNSRVAFSLHHLTLQGLGIRTLRAISRLLQDLPYLQSFKLIHEDTLGLPLGTDRSFTTTLPILASPTVTFVHWEVRQPGNANQALAHSIRNGGFPALRKLRAPFDVEGFLQALCRPIAKEPLPKHTKRAHEQQSWYEKQDPRSLAVARSMAQERIRDTKHTPAVEVVIEDTDDSDQTEFHVIGSYIGDVSSKVEYLLESDFPGADRAVGGFYELVHPHHMYRSCNAGHGPDGIHRDAHTLERMEPRAGLRQLF